MSGEKERQEDQAPSGLIDWLNLSVHFDLGQGHLENFPQVDNSNLSADCQIINLDDLPFLLPTILPNLEITAPLVISKIEYRRVLFGRDWPLTTLLRGPPSNA